MAKPAEPFKSPLCCYERYCGGRAVVVSIRRTTRSTTSEVRCLTCGRTGAISMRKERNR